MYMKQHILGALQEEFNHWEELLAGLNEMQRTRPLVPSNMSIKDDLAHLWAWQQRSIARVEAAIHDREPEFPVWPDTLDPNSEDATDQINAWVYESYRNEPWAAVYAQWREGFLRFLAGAKAISEKDLLDSGKYPWLGGYPLALIFLASYDHHHEHLEHVLNWLQTHASHS